MCCDEELAVVGEGGRDRMEVGVGEETGGGEEWNGRET